MPIQSDQSNVDIFVIGGGVNGCGIARDAAGRGLSVELAEMNDLAWATSSASTKMFHGGLRYLEYFKVRLVKEALIERETLLRAMPHISWPMRFVLPYHKDMRFEGTTPTSKLLGIFMPWMKGRRPAWLIRIGLFMYDHLGGREILPATSTINLKKDETGGPLLPKFAKAFEYSDCWVEDSRLVVLNARDAEARGAKIRTRAKVVSAERKSDHWLVAIEDTKTGETTYTSAKMLVNAAGPWVEDVIRNAARIDTTESVRLVRGSHIVTRKLYDHEKCYFLQGEDGRIIFAIPYENDFTLIGTTDEDHTDLSSKPACTEEEAEYLLNFASRYFKKSVTHEDIVWSYSGVRPLYDDGASSASSATRDYVLTVDADNGAPMLNVFGGKITTYRKLAEAALDRMIPFFNGIPGPWTSGVPLPGGDFPVDGTKVVFEKLKSKYPFLNDFWARRLVRAYGTEAGEVLAGATEKAALGQKFGDSLYEREVAWLIENEYAQTAEDIVWRRSKLGLRMSADQIADLDTWMQNKLSVVKA